MILIKQVLIFISDICFSASHATFCKRNFLTDLLSLAQYSLLIFTEMDEVLTPQQWYELQSRIRQQYPVLSDTDLQYHEAIEQDMLTMVACYLINAQNVAQRNNLAADQALPMKNYWRSRRHNRFRQLVK